MCFVVYIVNALNSVLGPPLIFFHTIVLEQTRSLAKAICAKAKSQGGAGAATASSAASGQLIDLLGDSSTDVAPPRSPSKSAASGADLLGDIDFLDPMSPQGSTGATSADASTGVDELDGAWDVEEGTSCCLIFFISASADALSLA